MTPFILRCVVAFPPETPPETCVYDSERQLWIDEETEVPVVLLNASGDISRYGETTITETREGADQSEIGMMRASTYGETTLTKTVEGADQGEVVTHLASRFGETTTTRAPEGTDVPESAFAQQMDVDAPYSHF